MEKITEAPLIRYMSQKGMMDQQVCLTFSLDKTVHDRTGSGKEKRFLRCFIGDEDVSRMVADFVGEKASTAKATKGCVIVTGTGFPAPQYLQNLVWERASEAGFPHMFDEQSCTFLGKHKRPESMQKDAAPSR